MRKKIHIVVFLLSIFITIVATLIFDSVATSISFNSLDYWTSEKRVESYTITSVVNDVDPVVFHERLNEIAKNNHLIVLKMDFGTTNEGLSTVSLYASDNDTYLTTYGMLEKGKIDLSDKTHYYTSSAEDRRFKLVGLGGSNDAITSIVNDPLNYGFYNFICLDGAMEENIASFNAEMKENYPQFEMSLSYAVNQAYVKPFQFINTGALTYYKKMKFAISFALVILLYMSVFFEAKKVSIYKIEGYSDLEIYWNMFLKPYLVDAVVLMAFVLLCGAIFYCGSVISLKYFLIVFASQFAQVHCISIVYSLLVLGIIQLLPIKNGIRGKNHLQQVFVSTLFVKCMVVLVAIPLVVPGIKNMYYMALMASRYNAVNQKLANMYQITTQIDSQYHREIATPKYIAIKDRLINEVELSMCSSGYYMDEHGQVYPDIKMYFLDQVEVCKQMMDASLFKEDEIYIFHRKGYPFDEQLFQDYADFCTYQKRNVNVVEYDHPVYLDGLIQLLVSDEIDYENPVLYIPVDDQFLGQIHFGLFTFDGSLTEAQNYLDRVFIEGGYGHVFRVGSYAGSYRSLYKVRFLEYMHDTVLWCIVMISYVLLTSMLIDIDAKNHYKKYYISYVEGVNPAPFMMYAKKICIPTIIVIAIYSLQHRIDFVWKDLGVWVAVFGSIEVLFYLKFIQRLAKGREKHGRAD